MTPVTAGPRCAGHRRLAAASASASARALPMRPQVCHQPVALCRPMPKLVKYLKARCRGICAPPSYQSSFRAKSIGCGKYGRGKHFGRLDMPGQYRAVAVDGAVDDPNSDTSRVDRQYAINVHGVVTRAIRCVASKLLETAAASSP